MDYADLRYFHVLISKFDTHPDVVGREALNERQNATVWIADE
jgi:hypothetical protein